jgi:hypothetical protein
VSVDEITNQLYALPPEEFTQARNEAARELRKAGEPEQADHVQALRKPSAAAADLNRLVRSHRAQVEAFLEAAAKLRDAQLAGKGDLGGAAQAERLALDELVVLGGESVRTALEAAAVDDGVAHELLAAQLVRAPEPAGFGTLLAHADPTAAKTRTTKQSVGEGRREKPNPSAAREEADTRRAPAPGRPDDRAARAGLREAKNALGAAATEERQARRRWAQTQRDLEKAQAAVEKAQRELDRLHSP